MTQNPIPDDISKPDRIEAFVPVGEEPKEFASSPQAFSSFMQKETAPGITQTKAQMISPFELAQQGSKPAVGGPNIDTLMAQVQLAQSSMTDLQNQMSYPNLKLKSSQKYVVKNKLTDANANFRAVNATLGAPVPEEQMQQAATTAGPLNRFLGYLTDGMNQMESAKRQLAELKSSGHNLKPADFLLIQIKLNKAQQEIDFTTVLVSKAVEDFKMMMNIQL